MREPGTSGVSGVYRGVRKGAPLLLFGVVAALPHVYSGAYFIRLLFVTLVWLTTSVAWNILGGFAGQVSFGFAVFYGLGAYTTALLLNSGMNRASCLLLGACVAAIASLLIGLPTFRLKGPYFAIATIGVSEAVRVVMTNLAFTGGASGYRIVERTRFNQREHFYTAVAIAAAAIIVSYVVLKSKLGLGLLAIREDEEAAAALGVNPFSLKLLAHALAAALAGVAGGVFARYAAFIHPQGVFAFHTSVAILLMPLIGGIGTIWGPVVGGAVYGLVQEELIAVFPQIHLLLYGTLLILIILLEPGGIVGLLRKFGRLTGHSGGERGSNPAR